MPTKNRKTRAVDELRPEYDTGVAEAFADCASVNRALRSYLRSRGKAVKPGAKPTRAVRT